MEQEKNEKKMKNLVAIIVLLGGLFVGSLFIDVVQLIRGKDFSQKALRSTDIFNLDGKTWVSYNDPVVEMTVLTDETCVECNPDEALLWLRKVAPTILVKKVDINKDGKSLADNIKIKTIPAFIFAKEVTETEFYTQAQSFFDSRDDKFVLNTTALGVPVGKYVSLPEIKEGDVQIGNKDAKVKIVEFSDFQCPYCKAIHPSVKKAVIEAGENVVFSYKHLPLSFHPQAENAALASECANEQGKFMDYADKLFTAQDDWGKSQGTAKFKTYATQLGLKVAQFNTCLDEKKYQDKINNDKLEAQEFGISGTPALFVNDQFKSGAVSYEIIKSMIDGALQKVNQ